MSKNLRFLFLYSLGSIALISIIVSCSTLSPVDSKAGAVRVFSSFEAIDSENVEQEWRALSGGVDYFYGRVSSPRLEFWALRIDLNAPGVDIVIESDTDTVSNFVRNNNLIAGINASPYDENHKNLGLVISNGTLLNNPVSRYDALVFYKDGQNTRAVIVSQADVYTTANIENAVGGYHRILADGQPTQRTFNEGTASAQRHPRSAAGVSSNGGTLYLLVIDGRRPGSVGATELETAQLLRALGSYNGLNLDGGGSSTLAIRYSDGTVKPANTPGSLGRERAVTSFIGVSAD